MRACLHHEAAGGEMIGKRIVHDIAGAEARGEERARHAPKIFARALRLEDWSRRHQQPPQAGRRRDVEAAERRALLLAHREFGLAQHRQLGKRRSRGHGIGIEAGELRCPSRRAQGHRDEVGQSAEEIALAIVGITDLEGIVMAIAHEVARGLASTKSQNHKATPTSACAAGNACPRGTICGGPRTRPDRTP